MNTIANLLVHACKMLEGCSEQVSSGAASLAQLAPIEKPAR